MLRLFGHYIAFQAIVLAALEAVLLYVLLLALTYFNVFGFLGVGTKITHEVVDQRLIILVTVVNFLMVASVGLYNRSVFFDLGGAIGRSAVTFPVVFVAVSVALYLYFLVTGETTAPYYPACMIGLVLFYLLIIAVRIIFIEAVNLDVFRRRVLVLGSGKLAARIDDLMRHTDKGHFTVVGYVRLGDEDTGHDLTPTLSGDLLERRHALANFIAENQIEEVVVASEDRRRPRGRLGPGLPVWDLLECKMVGTRVTPFATFWEREAGYLDLDELQPGWLIFSDGFRINWFLRFVERIFDVVFSAAFLIFTVPLFLFAIIGIKATSRGPVFYRQERVGLNGRTFELLKFRSMRVDAERDGVPRWSTADDDRITSFGRFMRKTRVDEIPQVINVLKGEMSFVGPRPERPFFVETLSKAVPYYNERHRAKPGITGWAQTNFPYGSSEEDAKRKLSYDLYYIKNSSLFLDILIIVQTVRVVLWADVAR